MMMVWFFIAAGIIGFVGAVIFGARKEYQRQAEQKVKPAPKTSPEEKYGHPLPPVSHIRGALHPVKSPYSWETWVEDKLGLETKLVVQLVESGEVRGRRDIDLRDTSMYVSWAEWDQQQIDCDNGLRESWGTFGYASNKEQRHRLFRLECRQKFHAHFTVPIRTWSRDLVSEIAANVEPDVLDYQFGEA